MKNIAKTLLAAMITLGFAACSDEELVQNPVEGEGKYEFFVNASMENISETRGILTEEGTSMKFSWELSTEGHMGRADKIYLIHPSEDDGTTLSGKKEYEFVLIAKNENNPRIGTFCYTGTENLKALANNNDIIENAHFEYRPWKGEVNKDYIHVETKNLVGTEIGRTTEDYPLQSHRNDYSHLEHFDEMQATGNLKFSLRETVDGVKKYNITPDASGLCFHHNRTIFKLNLGKFKYNIWGGSVVEMMYTDGSSENKWEERKVRTQIGTNSEWYNGISELQGSDLSTYFDDDESENKQNKITAPGNYQTKTYRYNAFKNEAYPICYADGDNDNTFTASSGETERPQNLVVYLMAKNCTVEANGKLQIRLIDGMTRDEYWWQVKLSSQEKFGDEGKRFVYIDLSKVEPMTFVCLDPITGNSKWCTKNYGAATENDPGNYYQMYTTTPVTMSDNVFDKESYDQKLKNECGVTNDLTDLYSFITNPKDKVASKVYSISTNGSLKPYDPISKINRKWMSLCYEFFYDGILKPAKGDFTGADESKARINPPKIKKIDSNYKLINSLTNHEVTFAPTGYYMKSGNAVTKADETISYCWTGSVTGNSLDSGNSEYYKMIALIFKDLTNNSRRLTYGSRLVYWAMPYRPHIHESTTIVQLPYEDMILREPTERTEETSE